MKQDDSVGQFTINALSGTFRFITGKSAKDAYQIKTSMGMIGVRGTAFDFVSKPDFGTTIVLFTYALLIPAPVSNIRVKSVSGATHRRSRSTPS